MPNPLLLSRRHLLAGLAALPFSAWSRAPATPLVLAMEATADIDPQGYLVSEKYDGVRAWWDGRSLRFRSGLPIHAPAWFLARLPAQPLDGELWLGRGRFEATSGAVRRLQPRDDEWRALSYMVFELPGATGTFAQRAAQIQALVQARPSAGLRAARQETLASRSALQQRLRDVVAAGGEGLVLHRADAPYVTGRSSLVQKLKPLLDAEATVLSHVPGRGKHEGRLGALRVRLADGTEFHLGTGLSDAQRNSPPAIGTEVTFTYRSLTPAGVPRFASFLRLSPGPSPSPFPSLSPT